MLYSNGVLYFPVLLFYGARSTQECRYGHIWVHLHLTSRTRMGMVQLVGTDKYVYTQTCPSVPDEELEVRNETLRAICKTPAWRKLAGREQALLLYLGVHIDDNGLYEDGHKRISDGMGVGIKTAGRLFEALEMAGFIEQIREGIGRISSEYRLRLPESSEQDGQGEGTTVGVPNGVHSEGTSLSPNAERVEIISGITPYVPQGGVEDSPPAETSKTKVLFFDSHLEPANVPPKPSHNAETRKSEEETETEEAGERFLDKEDGITPEMRAESGYMADMDAILQSAKPDDGREGT